MDATSRPGGTPRTAALLLVRVCALGLTAGLLAGCGGATSGSSGTGTADQGGDPGYGAPAPSSAGAGDAGGDQAAEDLVIVIEGFDYDLPDSVPAGAEIVVRNLDGVGHTVTADEGDTFDVAVGPGTEVTFTAPPEPGEYPFHCTPHPAMTGTLVVEGNGS